MVGVLVGAGCMDQWVVNRRLAGWVDECWIDEWVYGWMTGWVDVGDTVDG
jgi:hypothetical protein